MVIEFICVWWDYTTSLVAQLLDTGNMILGNDSDNVWQSFDDITDTTGTGMKFGKDFVTGKERIYFLE